MKSTTQPNSVSTVIVVTGAGKGIGEAFVKQLILELRSRPEVFKNPKLVLTSRTQSDLINLEAICAEASIACIIVPLELTLAPFEPIQQAIRHFGKVDALIHCAGVGRFGDFLDLTKEDLEFVMKTNVEASFLLMQECYREMKKQQSGTIQWVTSIAAEKALEQSAIYGMSKFAQRGLIEVMRISAYQDGIRITEIKPGATYTPMWGDIDQAMIKKMMKPEDVASAMINALFLDPRASIEEVVIRPIAGDL